MKSVQNVNGLAYLPRQDGTLNGSIGQHKIHLSRDNVHYHRAVALGTYLDDNSQKITSFETQPARYVRLTALTEAGNRGPWTSAAEINVYGSPSFTAVPNGIGHWGATIDFPVIPVAAAVEHDTGKVLVWSSWRPDTSGGSPGSQTATVTFDPHTQTVTQRTISNTNHDMFCPGLSIDATGRAIVTGGANAPRTSIYDPSNDNWYTASNMVIPRGYQSSVTIADGRTFVIGGSWSGGRGGKNGEIYEPTSNAWSSLPGCTVTQMLTNDAGQSTEGDYRRDNHGWLFSWKGNNVFQAGPSKAMNWYGMSGQGTQSSAGSRAADQDAMCGIAVMYDATQGKILSAGGSPNYSGMQASTSAHVITLGNAGATPGVTQVGSLNYARTFANAIVLPNGQVFVTGGQSVGQLFSDNQATLTPELFDPATNTFTKMAPNSIPRTYHSVGLLLLDGTVFSGGGGLCGGCSSNHFDAQIYSPPYLFNGDGKRATRPVIKRLSRASIVVGGRLKVTTDVALGSMSLVRFGSSTHTVNTDQRRIPLNLVTTGVNTYTVQIPGDPGIATPGYWMLFAMNQAGVPGVAKTVLIRIA